MCGILGIFGEFDRDSFTKHVETASDKLYRRGPDDKGFINIENFSGVHSRLIVQGSATDGAQPFEYNNITILFNGNLYNKNTLAIELNELGYKVSGVSDTEVVAISIYVWGKSAFSKFNGFFAIAYYDNRDKLLTLVRDKMGQKPVYYSQIDKSVYFSSTESMIPESFRGKIRQESYIDFITYGFVPAPFTMFENVNLLEPGSYISFSMIGNGAIKKSMFKYWSPIISNEIDNTNEAIELLSYELEKSVAESLLSSAKVACLYSGGVDSSLIFSYARDMDKEICAITADFGDHDDASERSLPLIRSYNHKNHILKEINKQDVDKTLSYLTDICESPFDDTSVIPSNIVFQTVKSQGYRVALTGDGADELFCGYESFSKLNKMSKILNPKFDNLRGRLNSIFDVVPDQLKDSNFQRFLMDDNSLLTDLSCNGFKKRAWGGGISSDYDPLHHVERLLKNYDGMDVISKFRMLNLSFRLPNQMLYKVDRTSMFNSVEARPVFLNNRIVELALKISSRVMMQNETKGLLKQICSKKLPTKEWKMPKTGFGWKTDRYSNIFNSVDDQYLYQTTKIKGSVLLRNKRSATKKRGYYGLRSLVMWQKNLSNKSQDGLL